MLTNFKLLGGGYTHQDSPPAAIVISDRHIQTVSYSDNLPDDCPVTDLLGLNITPGFIDLQLNGCGGVLLNNDISANTLDIMHETNLNYGCTAFLPTLITCSDEDIYKGVEVVGHYRKQHPERVPGLHLEGPFLNPHRSGIHSPELIRPPSKTMIDYLCRHGEKISMVTLAPELCPTEVIQRLSQAGIVVSIGHTNASCAEVKTAEQAGARFVTHLHNAMTPLTSRAPGVVGATFDSPTLCAGIIADGYHLDWENLRIAHRLLNERLVLVTDGTAAAGSAITEFEFGGQRVYHRKGKCTGIDGTLGGSALTMAEAVANSIKQGIPSGAAVDMATINAARAIGAEGGMGQVQPGQWANLTLLDANFAVRGTVSGGSLRFNPPYASSLTSSPP